MAFIRRLFENNTHGKSYKSLRTAKIAADKVVNRIREMDVETASPIDYMFFLNDDERVRVVFVISMSDWNNFAHGIITNGHCVKAL